MNRLLMSIFAAALLLIPFPVKAAYDTSSKAPPVAQKLVREGDFAFRLAATLKLGNPKNEAEAEGLLAHAGISPKNGWISDYPVTPVIMGQVQASVKVSANAGKVPMKAVEADRAVVGLGSELGIAVVTTAPAGAPPKAYRPSEADLDDYYEDEGTPVVTYYAPPPDYYYLYDWDPWPFWWGGFWFPGFFVLADFDFVVAVNRPGVFVVGGNSVIVANGVVVVPGTSLIVTNHVIDPVTRATVKVGPSGGFVSGASAWHGNAVKLASAPRPASLAGLSRTAFVNRVNSGKGQAAILNRSVTRHGSTTHMTGTRPAGAGAVSKGRSAMGGTSATSGRGATAGRAGPSPSGGGQRLWSGRGATGPTMGGRPSGGSRPYSANRPSGGPSMGGGRSPGGGGCRGRNC